MSQNFDVLSTFCGRIQNTFSLNSLLGIISFTCTSHIHLTILTSARWSATSFSLLTGQVSLPCNTLLHTQLLYSLPLLINGISLLVSNGTNCLNLFHQFGFWPPQLHSASPTTCYTHAMFILLLLLTYFRHHGSLWMCVHIWFNNMCVWFSGSHAWLFSSVNG